MTAIVWSSAPTGCQYRPPSFRIYVAPVVASPWADSPGRSEWHDEIITEHWMPVRMTWSSGGRPGALTLRRVLGAGPGKAFTDRADDSLLAGGARVRLVEVTDGSAVGSLEREWFRGYVGQGRLLVDASDDGESCEVVAYGPEVLLRGKVVSGQWHAVPGLADALVDGSFDPGDLRRANTFGSHLPAVFNAGGMPNAVPASSGAGAPWRLDSQAIAASAGSRVFDAPGRIVQAAERTYQAAPWDAASAIRSMIEMVDDYAVISPASVNLLPPGLADSVMGEVCVEGLSLTEAIAAVIEPLGFGYCIEPWADSQGRHALRVFELRGSVSGSRVRRPFMAPITGPTLRATDPEAQRAEVQRIEFVRDNRNVFNDVTVLGSLVRKQVSLTFTGSEGDLGPAWDTDEHDLSDWATEDVIDPLQWTVSGSVTVGTFDERYTYGAASAIDSRHAFRSFAWNEDGSLLGVTGQMGDLSNFGIASNGRYTRRPRPVGPTLLRDDVAKVRNLPPQVLLGIAGDDSSWIQVPAVIWTDRAGFTLPVNPLWRWYPYSCEQARNLVSGEQTLFEKYGGYGYLTLLNNALGGESPALAMKLVGSIECDQGVIGRAPRRGGSSWPIVASKVVRAGERFRRLEVPAGADPFALSSDRHDTRDDTADAEACACGIRAASEDETGHGSIVLRHVTRAYSPGDVIPGTRGRRIDLTVSGSEGSRAPVVVGLNWNLRPGLCKTELLLDTPMLRVLP